MAHNCVLIERTVDLIVQAVNKTRSGKGDELDFANVAGLEAHGGPGGNIEAKALGRCAVEIEGIVDFVKMEMAADLNRPISCICNSDTKRLQPRIRGEHGIRILEFVFAGNHRSGL